MAKHLGTTDFAVAHGLRDIIFRVVAENATEVASLVVRIAHGDIDLEGRASHIQIDLVAPILQHPGHFLGDGVMGRLLIARLQRFGL